MGLAKVGGFEGEASRAGGEEEVDDVGERLPMTADCGFGREGMSRRVAFYKMVAMVHGTNAVRRELGLPERPCRAAEPAFSWR